MVIKTERCIFTEDRVYPGHGARFVAKTGLLVIFASSKAASMYHQKKRAQRITWTQAWRRKNKKIRVEEVKKVRTNRKKKIERGYTGLSLVDLRARQTETSETRTSAREHALREIKDRKKAAKDRRAALRNRS